MVSSRFIIMLCAFLAKIFHWLIGLILFIIFAGPLLSMLIPTIKDGCGNHGGCKGNDDFTF